MLNTIKEFNGLTLPTKTEMLIFITLNKKQDRFKKYMDGNKKERERVFSSILSDWESVVLELNNIPKEEYERIKKLNKMDDCEISKIKDYEK